MISDMVHIQECEVAFQLGQPFLPFQQLLGVLPSASFKLLPEPFQVGESLAYRVVSCTFQLGQPFLGFGGFLSSTQQLVGLEPCTSSPKPFLALHIEHNYNILPQTSFSTLTRLPLLPTLVQEPLTYRLYPIQL